MCGSLEICFQDILGSSINSTVRAINKYPQQKQDFFGKEGKFSQKTYVCSEFLCNTFNLRDQLQLLVKKLSPKCGPSSTHTHLPAGLGMHLRDWALARTYLRIWNNIIES